MQHILFVLTAAPRSLMLMQSLLLLPQAIRSDNPVIFFEHVLLYNVKGEPHEGDYCQPLEKAELVREGTDVTIFTYSRMRYVVMQAVQELEKKGYNPEVRGAAAGMATQGLSAGCAAVQYEECCCASTAHEGHMPAVCYDALHHAACCAMCCAQSKVFGCARVPTHAFHCRCLQVVDLISLKPFDMETISKSIKKTRKALIVEECMKTGGIGASLSAVISESLFDELDHQVIRLSSQDVPTAYAFELEAATIVQSSQVVEAVEKMCGVKVAA